MALPTVWPLSPISSSLWRASSGQDSTCPVVYGFVPLHTHSCKVEPRSQDSVSQSLTNVA